MKRRTGWLLGILVCGGLAVISCGGRARVDGTDSNTHWLRECDRDSQCGGLSCICGLCSSACDGAGDCKGFGPDAACDVLPGCDSPRVRACVSAPVTTGGAGGSTGGSAGPGGGGGAGAGGSSSSDCAAMNARSNGDGCVGAVGYAWNGSACEPVICGCAGDDCSRIFDSADECDHAYRQCYEGSNVSRSCTTHADCTLGARTCCPPCLLGDGQGAGDVLIATATGAPSLRDAGICLGSDPQAGCGSCAPPELFTAYAACIEGECRLLDVTASAACTQPEDCRLATRDCCDCGGDFSEAGLIAVSETARFHYCPADQGCAECEGGEPAARARATCDSERGLCRVGFVPK